MKTLLSLLLIITLSDVAITQTTAIPDANFEQALINRGLDETIDGLVLTANIDTLTRLNVDFQNINDLTGIQDFTALTNLRCQNNQITNLDVTQNTALSTLYCGANQLTDLDVTQNSALSTLHCSYNQLTNLDVTQNTALSTLYCGANQLTDLDVTQNSALSTLHCSYNQLTNLDVTQNTALYDFVLIDNQLTNLDVTQNTALYNFDCSANSLTSLDLTQNSALYQFYCRNNQLTCLNVKNGNNTNIFIFFATENPNLDCIEVDDVIYSTTNWKVIDIGTSFSSNCNNACSFVGINEHILADLSLYPNPSTGKITIDLGEIKQDIQATLINSLGQVILFKSYISTNFINLDVDTPKGIYFLQLEVDGQVITKKILKE